MIQLLSEGKHFGTQRWAHLKFRRAGIVVQLANFVAGVVRILAYGNFDEFGRAGFEDAAERQLGAGRRRPQGRQLKSERRKGVVSMSEHRRCTRQREQASKQKRANQRSSHRVDSMREEGSRVTFRAGVAAKGATRDFAAESDLAPGRPYRRRACSACK